jgi:hypothetical protein
VKESFKSLLNAENIVKANQSLGTLFQSHSETSIQEAKMAELYRVFATEYCQNSHDPFTQFVCYEMTYACYFT